MQGRGFTVDMTSYMVLCLLSLCYSLFSLCYVILALRMEPTLGYGAIDACARGLVPPLSRAAERGTRDSICYIRWEMGNGKGRPMASKTPGFPQLREHPCHKPESMCSLHSPGLPKSFLGNLWRLLSLLRHSGSVIL